MPPRARHGALSKCWLAPVGYDPSDALKKIGRYEVFEELGRGPLGVVYRAHDPQKGRELRFKAILSARVTKESVRAHMQAAKRAGMLKHDGIARVFAVGEAGGKPFVTSELMDETISQLIDRRADLSLRGRILLVRDLATALAAAHAQGVVHTGLKASNVGLVGGRVKLLDFGSGAVLSSVSPGDSTRSAPILDGIRYQAPEVLEGQAADDRSDIYAVGVLLYEVLTFERPFTGTSVSAIVRKIVNQQIRALTQVDAAFPPSLDAIMARALARLSEGRYKTADDLVRDLERVAGSLPAVKEDTRSVKVVPAPMSDEDRRSLDELAGELARKVIEARRLYELGERKRCQVLMREVEAFTSDGQTYPGLDEALRQAVDDLAHTPAPLSPRGSTPDLYAHAYSLYQAGDHATCLATLQDLFAANPDHQQGRVLAMAVEKALRGSSGDPASREDVNAKAGALLGVGRTALSRGDLQAAETVQRALQSISPDGPELKEIRASLSEARLAALRALPPEPNDLAPKQAKPAAGKTGELRARLKAWLQAAARKLEEESYLEALVMAGEVVKVDPSRLEALTLMEKCIVELKARARERTLVSIEMPGAKPSRRKRNTGD